MKNILNLVKLEFMMDRKSDKKSKTFLSQFLSCFLIIVFSTLFSLFFIYAFKIIGNDAVVFGQLSFLLLAIMIIIFFYSLQILMKKIFFFKKKETLAYFPIKKSEIYYSKLIYCFLKTELLNIVLTIPALVVFMVLYKFGFITYLLAILVTFIVPLIPFSLANAISIPVMFVLNFFKNKNILSLCFTIVGVLVLFYFYMKIVFAMADILLSKDGHVTNLIDGIVDFCEYQYLPSLFLTRIILRSKLLINLLWYIGASIILFVLGILIGAISYKNIFISNLSEKIGQKQIKTTTKRRSAFEAYFVLEIKELFRKSNMLFTYVGMSVAMPFMVLYCNKFIVDFAVKQIGSSIITGTTLLVVLLFVSIICSPVSLFISKEGDKFWILKTNPNGIKIPLFAKSLVGICFSGVSSVVSVLIVCVMGYVRWVEGIIICSIVLVYIFTLISFGLILNLVMPNIFHAEKENTLNMAIMMIIGFIISTVLGIFSIIKSFSIDTLNILFISLGIVAILATIGLVTLFTQYKRLYLNMEV